MHKAITPVVSVILLIMLTIVASAGAYFFINSEVNTLQSSGAIEDSLYLDNSRLNLVSITGSQALVRNDGSSPVTEVVVLINGEALNYTLESPIQPGDIRAINYTSQLAGQDLEIKLIYNKGKTATDLSPASRNTPESGFIDENLPTNNSYCGDGICNSSENSTSCPEDCEIPLFYLEGITIKCPNAEIGQTFEYGDNTYHVVNDDSIAGNMTAGNRVCTSHVTRMTGIMWEEGFIKDSYTNVINISDWDTSSVTTMNLMFNEASDFNQNISDWDTSRVTDMMGMFRNAVSFNQNISNWNTSSVTNMRLMFSGAFAFNKIINNWDVSSVTNMDGMFFSAFAFNQNIGSWNVSAVYGMGNMFYNAYNFNQPIGGWDVSNVLDMNGMFNTASSFNQNINSWDTSSVITCWSIFSGCPLDFLYRPSFSTCSPF